MEQPYSDEVMDHFRRPRNVGSLDGEAPDVGTGVASADDCGDVVRLQLRFGTDGRVGKAVFKSFGCSAAIAAGSWATVWLTGRGEAEAAAMGDGLAAAELRLADDKRHCSALAARAAREAVADWRQKRSRCRTTPPDRQPAGC